MPHTLVRLFTKEEPVLLAGCEYLRSYCFDATFAAVHFCFSGFFCGIEKSRLSFIHNLASVLLVRIPGTYFLSESFKNTLYPMGFAAPLGSLLSAVMCVCFYLYIKDDIGKSNINITGFEK